MCEYSDFYSKFCKQILDLVFTMKKKKIYKIHYKVKDYKIFEYIWIFGDMYVHYTLTYICIKQYDKHMII